MNSVTNSPIGDEYIDLRELGILLEVREPEIYLSRILSLQLLLTYIRHTSKCLQQNNNIKVHNSISFNDYIYLFVAYSHTNKFLQQNKNIKIHNSISSNDYIYLFIASQTLFEGLV